MLVLSRKKHEIIDLEGLGSIVVVEIRGDKVRLGLELDKSVVIHRREVTEAIQAEQHQLLAEGNGEAETATLK